MLNAKYAKSWAESHNNRKKEIDKLLEQIGNDIEVAARSGGYAIHLSDGLFACKDNYLDGTSVGKTNSEDSVVVISVLQEIGKAGYEVKPVLNADVPYTIISWLHVTL